MKKIHGLRILLSVLLQNCNNGDCGECFTPPKSFTFEIVDKSTGENLFTNGRLDSNEISITNTLDNGASVEYSFISQNNANMIEITSIGWKTETVNLKIEIADIHIFTFYVDAQRTKGDCCEMTEYKNISITDSAFELDEQTEIYKILIP